MIKPILLDDQSYDQILDSAKKAIRKYAPYWTDENAHDPGITLIEMMAWLKEMLQFYMDQTTEDLERQFLSLLGKARDFGAPSQTVLQAPLSSSVNLLPAGSVFKSGRFIFETTSDYWIESVKIIDVTLQSQNGTKSVYNNIDSGLSVYPFGTHLEIGSRLNLYFDKPLALGVIHHFYLRIAEEQEYKRNPIKNADYFEPLGQIRWSTFGESGVDCEAEVFSDETRGLLQSGVISLKLGAEMARTSDGYRLSAELTQSSYELPPRILNIYNRAFPVVQLQTLTADTSAAPTDENAFEDQPLTFSGTGLAQQSLIMPFDNVFFQTLLIKVFEEKAQGEENDDDQDEEKERERDKDKDQDQDKDKDQDQDKDKDKDQDQDKIRNRGQEHSKRSKVLKGNWETWHRVSGFEMTGPASKCYVVDFNENAIIFGNNEQGRIPPKGKGNIKIARLQRTFLEEGNISVKDLEYAQDSSKFSCLSAAEGGRAPKTLSVLKGELASQIPLPKVAVTAKDYELILKQTPGLIIRSIKCMPLFRPEGPDGSGVFAENEVTIFVQPDGTQKHKVLNEGYRKNLEAQMQRHRLITTEVHICSPTYYDIKIYCEVYGPLPDEAMIELARKAVQRLDCFNFGQSVTRSEIYKALIHINEIHTVGKISISAKQTVLKNNLGDLLIPPGGIALIDAIEVNVLRP